MHHCINTDGSFSSTLQSAVVGERQKGAEGLLEGFQNGKFISCIQPTILHQGIRVMLD